MDLFWFIVATVFFILFVSKKSSKIDEAHDYRHGYWDGYRALGDKVQAQLNSGQLDRKQLQTYIDEGYPQPEHVVEAEEETHSIAHPAQVQEVAMPQPTVELTLEQREQKTTRNLNAILYVASFLLVAAAAVFVAANMPEAVRLVGLWSVVVMFYSAGLLLHRYAERLRPAAAAFTGTGLAILPFAGYALHLIGNVPGEGAWLITSVVGVVAYFAAAIVMKSQLVSYLTMAFVLSLALSSVAVASAPIVWYFIMLIGVSLLASTLSFIKPAWLPELFRKPIETTGQTVTPVALVASVVVYQSMSLPMYEVVFGVATAHYLVAWLQTRSGLYETISRVLAYATLLLVAFDLSDQSAVPFAIYWLALAALQAGYSLIRLFYTANRAGELVWLGMLQGVILFGTLLWIGNEHAAAGTLADYATIGVISVLTTLKTRQVLWAIPALIASLVAPFIVGRWLAWPVWDWQLIAWIFIVAAVSVIGMYYLVRDHRSVSVQRFLEVSFWLYLATSIATVFGQSSWKVIGIVAIVAALLGLVFSYLCRQSWGEVATGMLYILAVSSLLTDTTLTIWYTTVVVLACVISFYIGAALHDARHQRERRNIMLAIAHTTLAGLIFNFGAEKQVVVASLSLLLIASVVSFGLRVATRQKSMTLQQIYTVSYVTYIALAWLFVLNLESYWSLVVYAVAALLFWTASYIERAPGLVIGGNLALVAGVASLWNWLELPSDWTILGVAWISAAILYAAYWMLGKNQDVWRRQACLVSVWVILGGAALVHFADSAQAQAIAAASTIVALAATIAAHGYEERNRSVIEMSIYLATFGMQRIVGLAAPELNIVLYAHWWALVVGLVAWWRQNDGNLKGRLIIAVGFVTAGTGIKALEVGDWYQLLFLGEHAALLVAGALKQASWALWWGIVAVVVAVLYFLRDYPYIALAFLGLVLIAIVIWRLSRSGKEHTKPHL